MVNYIKNLKSLIFFEEPEKIEEFILKESNDEGKAEIKEAQKDSDRTPELKKRDRSIIKKPMSAASGNDSGEEQGENKEKDSNNKHQPSAVKPRENISTSVEENLRYMKDIFTVPDNGDIVIREFEITFKGKPVKAFIILIDGMTDRTVINSNILHPLMILSDKDFKTGEDDIGEFVKSRLLPHNQMKVTEKYQEVIDEINFGGCGLFVDGSKVAFAADVKGWLARGIERPNTELVLRGPQEGFNEILRANTALVRKILKDEDLIVENAKVGKRSKTPCSILYIKDIANESLVEEVKRRVNSIKLDYIIDSGHLEQLLEDDPYMLAPQIIATERPDRVAAALTDGKIAIIMHGSPFALVLPTTNNDLIHAAEDSYIRFPYANLLRCVRILGVFMSLLLPGLYVAITNYHQEMIPTDLLLAIVSAREKVPFPTVVEILIMEVAFELIREAGIRIPGPIGPTLGIIGALILGQAAVAANIVSPILIIIVAVTGIGSFAIPNFSLAYAFRILRFAYILLGASAGFLGITTGLFLQGVWLTAAKSFGVPFMAPFAPKTSGGFSDEFLRPPFWKQETRPDYVNPRDTRKQPKISRVWTQNNSEGDANE
ncbi:MAG: spore germination protein [Clostridia bacterium]|nr:spore germination protein [Clostridia bacterium]